MEKPRTSSFALSILVYFFASLAGAFPTVLSVQGKAWLTSTDGLRIPVKAKMNLRGKALLETEAHAQIHIAWDRVRELTVLESSSVLIPTIGWDSGEATLILLKSGSFRWLAPEEKTYNVALSSDLYEFIAPPGDFILSYDPNGPYAEVKMIKGSMEFTYLNGEEIVKLTESHKVGFQGVLEDGKVAYDILLQGRKVPRGKLTTVTDLDSSFLKANDTAAEKRKAAEMERQHKAALAKKALGQICKEPGARFNQCAWICEGNPKKEKKICRLEAPHVQCVQQRCNANGQWAEKVVIEDKKAQTLCKAEPRVGVCDY